MRKMYYFLVSLLLTTNASFAQQWAGSSTTTGDIYRDGNVGIGTTSPQAKLDVNGLYYLNRPPLLVDQLSTLGIPNGSYLGIAPTNLSSSNNSYMLFSFPTNNAFRIGTNYDGHLANGYYRDIELGRYLGDPYMIIKDGGNVGIGTTNPGSFKLAVEGKIGAREVRVTAASPWPDYVFNKKYELKNLYSLESYIRQNNHLPNIPSAQEVKDNGIELGQMNAKLLQKIEELTLYVIDLKKEIDLLKKERR